MAEMKFASEEERKAYNRAKSARYRARHPDRAKEIGRKSDAKRNHAARSKAWREANPGKRLAYNAKRGPEANAQERKRQAAKLQATPRWADAAEIATIYEAAWILGMDVDHIVPLNSKKVCGLHCPANLQLLDPIANRSKGNRFWPDMFEEE